MLTPVDDLVFEAAAPTTTASSSPNLATATLPASVVLEGGQLEGQMCSDLSGGLALQSTTWVPNPHKCDGAGETVKDSRRGRGQGVAD
jgi:hypothetical protein